MRKSLKQLKDWIEYRLRLLCGKLPKDARIITIVILFILLAISYLFLFIDVLSDNKDAESIRIEHIDGLQLKKSNTVKPLNFNDNER